DAVNALKTNNYDLAILDVMLPDIDGFNLAKQMQQTHFQVPFLFLTARSLKTDVLKGFSVGAIDYLKKPIDEEELVARIHALLSRVLNAEGPQRQKTLHKIGNYSFDSVKQQLEFKGEIITLTSREGELLLYLLNNTGSLCSHKDILIHLWGKNDYFNRKSLNVFISHLRKYLSKDDSVKIANMHGKGFILKA
ncbi:MAG: response regulator transcription factor, partial [Leeuwenhoekiella sp.]